MNIRLRAITVALSIAISIAFISCSNDSILVDTIFANSGTYTEYVDQTPIELATFRLDSVQTSGRGTVWIGHHKKKVIGDVYSQSYVRLEVEEKATAVPHNQTYEPTPYLFDSYDWAQKEKYDSVTIVLYHTGAYQGDTTKAMTINVKRLAQPLKFAENEKTFYNVRTFRDSTSIGSFRFVPRPHSRPRLRYRLDDSFGRELVSFIKANKANKTDVRDQNFEHFLGGIKLESGDDAKSLLAFANDSVRIMLHSHITDVDKIKITRKLVVSDFTKQFQFNSIWTENEDSPYDCINHRSEQVNEKDGGQHSVMFEGLGYYTRINFPTIRTIADHSYFSHIVRANLVLYPERNGYDKHNFPQYFYVASVNKGNVSPTIDQGHAVLKTVTTSLGTPSIAKLHNNLTDPNDVYYTIDITNYLNTVIASGNIDVNEGLVLSWSGVINSADYNFMIFNGRTKNKYYSYLELYYYNYDRENK